MSEPTAQNDRSSAGVLPDYTTPEPTVVESALTFLTNLLTDLGEAVPTDLDGMDADAAVQLLADLRERRMKLAEIEAFTETHVARALHHGKHTVAGFQVEIRGGASWKDWRHDDVAWQLCRDIAVDPDTGEVNADVTPIIDMVRSRLLNAARPEWRTTVLRQHGIDPADYSTRTPSRRTVQLTADAS